MRKRTHTQRTHTLLAHVQYASWMCVCVCMIIYIHIYTHTYKYIIYIYIYPTGETAHTITSAESKAFEALVHGTEETLSKLLLARVLGQIELVEARMRRREPVLVSTPMDVEFLPNTPTSARLFPHTMPHILPAVSPFRSPKSPAKAAASTSADHARTNHHRSIPVDRSCRGAT